MNLGQLKNLFAMAGAEKLYAKQLAENDNSKNQIYFAGTNEALNAFPSEQILAANTKKGPSFKARLNFSWLLESGQIVPAPNAQFILYAQYPEIRFSGFLNGCKVSPNELMWDRQRAQKGTTTQREALIDRILFIAVTKDRRLLGYVVAGNSTLAREFRQQSFEDAFVVFKDIPLPNSISEAESRTKLMDELCRIHRLGWINSKQLDGSGTLKPCNASQCGGFTLEAELGVPKNSKADPDFLGWEVKQHAVSEFDRKPDSKAITLLTPEPDQGYYPNHGVEAFIRKFGYPDKSGKPDRFNFGGRYFIGKNCPATNLEMQLLGFDSQTNRITDANGSVALVSQSGEIAAAWGFQKILEHWTRKHIKAVYIPSKLRKEPCRQYSYGDRVRLAVGTNPLHFLNALASQSVYYDPGIKLENASTKPKVKSRCQFRIASKNLPCLYDKMNMVNACDA